MRKHVEMTTAVPESQQETCFMNATMQGTGTEVVVSIATFVHPPAEVIAAGENAVALWVRKRLTEAASEDLTFEAQVGPSEDASEDDDPLEEDEKRDRFILYVSSESCDIVDEGHVYECDDYMDAIQDAMNLIGEDYDFYRWADATVNEMLVNLLKISMADMHNGRALYIIPWDGKEDAIEVARRHDEAQNVRATNGATGQPAP